MKKVKETVISRLGQRAGLPVNHDIVQAVLNAQQRAFKHILTEYLTLLEKLREGGEEVDKESDPENFIAALKDHIKGLPATNVINEVTVRDADPADVARAINAAIRPIGDTAATDEHRPLLAVEDERMLLQDAEYWIRKTWPTAFRTCLAEELKTKERFRSVRTPSSPNRFARSSVTGRLR
jgi:hypothetical protein